MNKCIELRVTIVFASLLTVAAFFVVDVRGRKAPRAAMDSSVWNTCPARCKCGTRFLVSNA